MLAKEHTNFAYGIGKPINLLPFLLLFGFYFCSRFDSGHEEPKKNIDFVIEKLLWGNFGPQTQKKKHSQVSLQSISVINKHKKGRSVFLRSLSRRGTCEHFRFGVNGRDNKKKLLH